MKKQSFITGAFLLAVATGLGKIFSAIFKIPLDRFFLHAEGMAVFNGVYNVYMFFFAAATAGIPLAVSRLVAAAEDEEDRGITLSTAMIFVSALLFVAGVFIFIFADSVAASVGMEDTALAFRVMSPALIFCGITASARGYFQGKMTMLPSALSQVSDSFGRFLLGTVMAITLCAYPSDITAAGAISGVPFGAVLSAAILLIALKKSKVHITAKFSPSVLKTLLLFAVPITLTASMHTIFNMADTLSVVPILKAIGVASPKAAFGCLSRAATLYALPVSLATAVAASVLPAIAESTRDNNTKNLNRDASLAIRLSLAISVPCAAGFIAIPVGILQFLFENSENYHTLSIIGVSAVFLSVGEVIACILQGMGKVRCTVVAAVCAILLKLSLNFICLNLLGVNGASISTAVSYFAFMTILLGVLLKTTPIKLSFTACCAKPLFCGLMCYLAAAVASQFFGSFVCIVIAVVVYIPSVLLTRFVEWNEINQIFSGHKIPCEQEQKPV